MAYKTIDKNRYVKNYSYVRAPKVVGIEDPDLTPNPPKPPVLPFVENGLWIGGVNNGLPNGYYVNGTNVGVPDGNWLSNSNQGKPTGYFVDGVEQNHRSTLGLKISANFAEEISYINEHNSTLISSAQHDASKLAISSNLNGI